MKLTNNTSRKVIAVVFIFIFTFNTLAYAGYNPSREEVEDMIDEVAAKRAIPSVILKSIARVESVYEHFNSDGSPKISGSSIGLMQVNNIQGGYDSGKLKYDILYNIEAGADVLLNKWSMSSYQSVSCVGNMDPDVLENWYFALWAYNGWAQSNNPHMLSSYGKRYTYQQLIYNIAEKEYGQKINNIDISYLPQSGKPSRSLVVPTPSYTNSGNIVLYEKGDYVRTDGVRNVFDDIAFHWSRKVVMKLYNDGLISESAAFYPDNIATKEEFLVFLSKAIEKNGNKLPISEDSIDTVSIDEGVLPFSDAGNIHSWAVSYINHVNALGLLKDYNGELKPQDKLTRIEASNIIENIFGENKTYANIDIKTIFSDLSQLNDEGVKAVKSVYTNGIMAGKRAGSFCPDEYLTRAEAAAIMVKINEKLGSITN